MALPSEDDDMAIPTLANKYSDAVNTRDWTRYRSCWTEDGIWQLGPPVDQTRVGIEAIMVEVQHAVGAMDLFVQMNHATTVLSMSGDTAVARTTVNEIGRILPDQRELLGGAEGLFILAIYTDDLRRVGGVWRYARRAYQVLLFDGHPPRGEVYPFRTPKDR